MREVTTPPARESVAKRVRGMRDLPPAKSLIPNFGDRVFYSLCQGASFFVLVLAGLLLVVMVQHGKRLELRSRGEPLRFVKRFIIPKSHEMVVRDVDGDGTREGSVQQARIQNAAWIDVE